MVDHTHDTVIAVNVGLSDESRLGVVELLSKTLADQHVLYMKLRNYHWNVTGPQFMTLHELFEKQYEQIKTSIDETAEFIRTYGEPAPGTMQEMLDMARLSETPGDTPDAHTMVANLVADHEAIITQIRADIDTIDDDYDDDASEDYYTQMLQDHLDMAWMLRTFIQGNAV
ncbi:MAG: DNA starvation/stationary phase protection protein [Chloroflexota bacterium]